jgi:hypothetical protein
MGSPLFKNDLLTGLEPGTPGGETPPSTAGGTPAATEARLMERLFLSLAMLAENAPVITRRPLSRLAHPSLARAARARASSAASL